MVDIGKCRFRKKTQTFRVDGQDFLAFERIDRNKVGGQFAIRGGVFAKRKKIGGACCLPSWYLACLPAALAGNREITACTLCCSKPGLLGSIRDKF
ncbi:hypothetical protein HED55_03385 [Ochrobactrum haematophilum]|uniref:Uncharacterized protein n=1 Tax=Brucella haematophila TaxID=419474 RepID=A0ABX1DIG4_9HYPH|nr:hypothetical protein [Brucella haematophila]